MKSSKTRARPGRTTVASKFALTLLSCAILAALSSAHAEDALESDAAGDAAAADAPSAADAGTVSMEKVVVSARKRDELLVDVPVSVSAVGANAMERNNLHSVADIAPYVPGLNINSDSVGRAFVSIRGIGTALQAGVQPGVGVFQDGIYVRETSYVNNPLLDIDHIEVLRGPQGTLYGKNTLGGAINIITRPPSELFEAKVYGEYNNGNDNAEFGGRISGSLSEHLRARFSFASRDNDGFYENKLTGENADASKSKQANLGFVWDVGEAARLTTNTYYLDSEGGSTNYSAVDGPHDYRYNVRLNVTNRQDFIYSGSNVKLTTPVFGATSLTAVVAYDRRDIDGRSDGDFLPLDIVRTAARENDDTYTAELRFDTQHSDTFSTLFGVFGSREEAQASNASTLVPRSLTATAYADRTGDTYAAFGTAIWRFAPQYELSFGLRVDHESRHQDISNAVSVAPGVLVPSPRAHIGSTQVQPRVSLTKFYDSGWMSYASIAKGYRGGGFNAPNVPSQFLTYDGDTVWTYELGAKYASPDQRWQFTGAVYYNDYRDFIGQNGLTRNAAGGLVSVDLNLGDVKSRGFEAELVRQINDWWSIRGDVSLMRARITDQSGWIALTGHELATDRLLFQPDWTAGIASDMTFPIGSDRIDWNLGVNAKGSRPGSSFDPVTPSILSSYAVANTSVTYKHERFTATVFANNLFDKKYFESYIDGSLLSSLGLLDQNLGILGAGRTVGVRLAYKF